MHERTDIELRSASEAGGDEGGTSLVSGRRRMAQGWARSSLLWFSYLGQYFVKKHSILFSNTTVAEQRDEIEAPCACLDSDDCETVV